MFLNPTQNPSVKQGSPSKVRSLMQVGTMVRRMARVKQVQLRHVPKQSPKSRIKIWGWWGLVKQRNPNRDCQSWLPVGITGEQFFFKLFLMWTIFLKSLLNLLHYCFCSMLFWFFVHEACGIPAPWPGIKPTTPALEGEVLTTGPPGKSLTGEL